MPNQFTHPWTQSEIKYLKENIYKLKYKQIGKIIDRSPPSIQSKIRYLPITRKKVQKHPVDSNFFKVWSPEMAYALGFIAADGNICHSGRAYALHIACDDEDVINKLKVVMRYKGPVNKKYRFNGKISYSLRLSDPIIFNDLQRLGVTERKSFTFTPPKIPKDLIRHFIRGYFDGDGTVYLRNFKYPSKLASKIYTASLSMAKFVHELIVKVGGNDYQGKVLNYLAHQKNDYYVISLGHQASIKFFNYMYKETNLYLERKYKKFLEGMNYGT